MGTEFGSLNDSKKIDWIINAVENTMLQPVPLEQKRRILQKLNEGVMFEKFLHTKYIGQKRFSLEGVKVPLLHWMRSSILQQKICAGSSDRMAHAED